MSNIYCGSDILNDVKAVLSTCKMVVTDSNLASIYRPLTKGAFVIPAGEKNKNPETLLQIVGEMQKRKLKRGDSIAAIGGGVVGDMTGFAAAIYMRGINWVSIPTSLLAMVDSGIGGKTAVDFGGVKNLIGAFLEPTDIVINTSFLNTLPEREWLCGIGELVKTCLLSPQAYDVLTENLDGLRAHDSACVNKLVRTCVDIKSAVVKADLKETGLRKILNVGHTVGHALESLDGYKLSHGEYVIKGMMTEMAMCRDLVDNDFYNEMISLLLSFTTVPRTTAKSICDKAGMDKKNDGNTITIMLPTSAGNITEVKMEYTDFISRYNDALRELRGA